MYTVFAFRATMLYFCIVDDGNIKISILILQEKRAATRLDSKVSVVIPKEEQEYLRQPANQLPDEATVG